MRKGSGHHVDVQELREKEVRQMAQMSERVQSEWDDGRGREVRVEA